MEMGFENEWSTAVMESLSDDFTLSELEAAMQRASRREQGRCRAKCSARWNACAGWRESNYEVHFDPSVAVSERIIFPVSSNESNGMEDARFVRFVEDDGTRHLLRHLHRLQWPRHSAAAPRDVRIS